MDISKNEKTSTDLANMSISKTTNRLEKNRNKGSVLEFYPETSEWQLGLGIKTNREIFADSLFTFVPH